MQQRPSHRHYFVVKTLARRPTSFYSRGITPGAERARCADVEGGLGSMRRQRPCFAGTNNDDDDDNGALACARKLTVKAT